MPDLHAHDHAVERGQGLLELEPGVASAAGCVDRFGVLEHQALVATLLGLAEDPLQLGLVGSVHERGQPEARRARKVEPLQPPAALTQRLAQQWLRRPPLPQREHIEGDVDDRHLGHDLGRRLLAPDTRLQLQEGQHGAVLPGQQLTVEDPVPGHRASSCCDLGEAVGDVVEIAAEQAHLVALAVQLGADAVVLVLDPHRRPHSRQRRSLIHDGAGQHRLERVEEGEPGAREGSTTSELGRAADVTGEHASPLHRRKLSLEGGSDALLEVTLAQADAELAAEDGRDVARAERVRATEEPREHLRLGLTTARLGELVVGRRDVSQGQGRRIWRRRVTDLGEQLPYGRAHVGRAVVGPPHGAPIGAGHRLHDRG